jgi:outer membrane protein OmpA-like peptidoglycan-associated protein
MTSVALALVLAGCAGLTVEKARNTEVSGGKFEQTLYAGYLSLAESEFDEGDYPDSDRFAARAIRSAKNERVAPETIADRDLPGEWVGALSEAHRRLVTALDAGARDSYPAGAAEAQLKFDCWMQEQEENFQPEDIAACRDGFATAIASLEDAMRPQPVAAPEPQPVAAPEPAPAPAPEPAPNFLVYFDFDSAKLGVPAEKLVEQIAAAALKHGATRVVLSAHADRAGHEDYNQTLSELRAAVVIDALKQGGLAVAVDAQAFGEKRPFVPTGDGVAEPGNRVVFVTFDK